MKPPRKFNAFTLIELLVVIAIIAVLASFAVPAVTGALTKGQLMQSVNNGRQLQQLSQMNALDATTTGDPNIIGWPAANSFADWVGSFTNTISTNDVAKLFAAAGVTPAWSGSAPNRSAFMVYQVSESSSGDTIFLTTQNWLLTTDGGNGPALAKGSVPYGDKGFVVVRKGGDAAPYVTRQAGNPVSFFGSFTNQVADVPDAQ